MNLAAVAKKMARLDLCMMQTRDGRGTLHSRPMSNNGEVEYDGNTWFFTYEGSAKVRQIRKNSKTTLIYQTAEALFVEICGRSKIITDKEKMRELWFDELNRWFPEGLETPGICLIQVIAERVHLWDKDEEGVMVAEKQRPTSKKKSKK